MKKKPDVSGFMATAKDPTAFLEGGTADTAERGGGAPAVGSAKPEIAQKPELTVQKLFRLSWDVASALKQDALSQSLPGGKRVTETEIVEHLLRQRYSL